MLILIYHTSHDIPRFMIKTPTFSLPLPKVQERELEKISEKLRSPGNAEPYALQKGRQEHRRGKKGGSHARLRFANINIDKTGNY